MTRLKNAATAHSTEASSSPLTADELLLRDNIPATATMPPEIEAQLTEEIIYVATSEAQLDAMSLSVRNEDRASVSIALPKNAFIGRPVRTTEFLTETTLQKLPGTTELPPFRPDWFPNVLHPKHTSAPPQPVLRSREGKEFMLEALFPPENRRVFFPSGYPWHCIGRLFVWRNAGAINWDVSGTAVLVGSRVVLTCSHLMPFGSASWKCLFVPAYFDGAPVAGAGAASWVSDFRGFRFAPDDQAFDMAVLRLYDPLGSGIGFFGAKVYHPSWQDQPLWTLAGYPGDIANAQRPSGEASIRVLDDDSDGDFLEIEHRADTADGNSGGPLFGVWPDGFPYVIGTHSGYEYHSHPDYENHNVAAGGKGMVNLINWARNTWQ